MYMKGQIPMQRCYVIHIVMYSKCRYIHVFIIIQLQIYYYIYDQKAMIILAMIISAHIKRGENGIV